MNDFIEPTSQIYSKLLEVPTAYDDSIMVAQDRPERIETLPAITFEVENNVPQYGLDKSINKQDITIKVDIWGETSKITGSILKIVIEKLLELDYRCTFNQALVDPTGISHRTTQFEIAT